MAETEEPSFTMMDDDGDRSSELRWLLRPALFGLVGAVAGSLLWYAVLAATGVQIRGIALILGVVVGGAVRLGARRQRGLACQLLAVALTYGAIAASYVPFVAEAMARDQINAAALAQQPDSAAPAAARVSHPALPARAAIPPGALGPGEWTLIYLFAVASAIVLPFTQLGTGIFSVFLALAWAAWMNKA